MKQVRLFTCTRRVQARFAPDGRGAAMVEYVVLMALVAVLGAPAVGFVGTNVSNRFNQVAEQLAPEEQPLDDGNQCDHDHGNQGDHGNNDGDQDDGNHDDGNQGNNDNSDQGNNDGDHDNGNQCGQNEHGNQGDHGNNDGDQDDGNHDDGNQGHHDNGGQGNQDG
jgi:Flp pilus assembly pilin Flp